MPCKYNEVVGPSLFWWHVASRTTMVLICACTLVRGIHAAVVLHTTVGMPRGTRQLWLVVPMHATSVIAGLCATISAIVAHFWLDITTDNDDAPFFIFFTAEFTMFLMYDAWLLLRDRALQCEYFQTPKNGLIVVYTLISLVVVVICMLYARPKNLKTLSRGAILLYIFTYWLQLFILAIMTFLFTRPLLRTFGTAAVIKGADKTAAVMLDVMKRTAVGSVLHLITTLFYVVLLFLWDAGVLCQFGRGLPFYVSVLGFLVHLNISHRDDLPVRRLVQLGAEFFCSCLSAVGGALGCDSASCGRRSTGRDDEIGHMDLDRLPKTEMQNRGERVTAITVKRRAGSVDGGTSHRAFVAGLATEETVAIREMGKAMLERDFNEKSAPAASAANGGGSDSCAVTTPVSPQSPMEQEKARRSFYGMYDASLQAKTRRASASGAQGNSGDRPKSLADQVPPPQPPSQRCMDANPLHGAKEEK